MVKSHASGLQRGGCSGCEKTNHEPLGWEDTPQVIPPETHLLPENISNLNKPKSVELRVAYGVYVGKFQATSSMEEGSMEKAL